MKNKNLLYTIVFNLILIISSSAQEIVWQKTIGGANNDRLNKIVQTSDNGYIMGGTSSSDISGEKTENSNGGDDYWTIKTDSFGNIQWQNTIGGSGTDGCSSIHPTSDGGYILGGTSDSPISGDKTDSSFGGKDYWVLKLDVAGNIQWQRTLGGSSNDELLDVVETSDGGYLAGGTSYSDTTGIKTEHKMGQNDYWIIKLNSSGVIQWQNTIGGSSSDVMAALQETSDRGFILGGNSSSPLSGDKTEDSVGLGDYWIVKLDSLGTIQWQNTIGGSSYDFFDAIQQTTDHGYILGGVSTSPADGDRTSANFSGADLWIIKVDSVLGIEWQRNIGGTSADFCKEVRQTYDNGYLISAWGNSNIAGNKTVDGFGSNAFWVIKLDASGNDVWQNSIGGASEEYSQCCIEIAPNEYMFAGYGNSNISGQKTEDSRGLFDYWLVRMTENYSTISGKSYIDLNSNSIWDLGEPALSNHVHHESLTGRVGISKPDGSYKVNVIDTGNFTITPDSLLNFVAVPAQHSAYLSSVPQFDSLNDFAFQPIGTINDLQVSITRVTAFRPGFRGRYNIHYKNTGTTALTPNIYFLPDSATDFDSSSVVPTFSALDSAVWNLPSMNPFDEGNIEVWVYIHTTSSFGDTIQSISYIEPISGDSYPDDNNDTLLTRLTGSFDPNDISVDRTSILTTELTTQYLEYTIRFQNTGNDTAFTVRINNPISDKLVPSTFEFLTSSHVTTVNFTPDNQLWFQMDNILLPDSNVNEAASHGFVKYRIKASPTLSAGETIYNEAFIYFDYNPAVPTYSVSTQILLPTAVKQIMKDPELSLYPNPTTGDVRVSFNLDRSSNVKFDIFNSQGLKVKSVSQKVLSSGYHQSVLSLSDLPEGVYMIQYLIDSKVVTKRVVVM